MATTTAEFTINLTPADPLHEGTGRFDFTKTWTGGLTGTSTGSMLSGGDPSTGVAGYVAIEVFTGTVDGREGTFALQQFGTMDGGEPELVYLVTPGSGTGALTDLRGLVEMDVVDGVHRVEFEYAL